MESEVWMETEHQLQNTENVLPEDVLHVKSSKASVKVK